MESKIIEIKPFRYFIGLVLTEFFFPQGNELHEFKTKQYSSGHMPALYDAYTLHTLHAATTLPRIKPYLGNGQQDSSWVNITHTFRHRKVPSIL